MNVKSPNNISKWQMGFNSAFKGLTQRYLHPHSPASLWYSYLYIILLSLLTHLFCLFHPSILFSFLFCFLATACFAPTRDTKWLIYKLIFYSSSSVFLCLILFSLLSHVFLPNFLLLLSFAPFSILLLSDTHIKRLYFLIPVQFASLMRLTLDCTFAFKAGIIRIQR
jgi:hypothetical protein